MGMSGKPTDEAARELRARQVQGREPAQYGVRVFLRKV